MRIGAIWHNCPNAYYRAIDPLKAMALRGHEIVLPTQSGNPELHRLQDFDVVHVYRRGQAGVRRVLKELADRDVAITYGSPSTSPTRRRAASCRRTSCAPPPAPARRRRRT